MSAILSNIETNTINDHLKKKFSDSELDENSVIRNFRITATETQRFFATVQNKLYWAIYGNTGMGAISGGKTSWLLLTVP